MSENEQKDDVREKPSINVQGIQMPAHQIRQAIAHAVTTGQVESEELGEEIYWLYSFAKERTLGYKDLAAVMRSKLGDKFALSDTTINLVFHGNYQAANWIGVIKSIVNFRKMIQEEEKRKNIGFVMTDTARIIFNACTSALNDGIPAFIYGASQIGKTTALLEFQRLHNHGRTKYLRLGSHWTKSRLVRELAAMLGNGVKATKSWVLEDAIFAGLSRFNLLIVDEFHLALETTTEYGAKEIVEFLREVYDRTGCGLVLSSTKVGLEGLENGKNKMLFDQLRRRGVIKAVLPDVPKVKDINAIARSFDLPVPAGQDIYNIKMLLKTMGLGVFLKYLQKAYALAKADRKQLDWQDFKNVHDGYAALAELKNEY